MNELKTVLLEIFIPLISASGIAILACIFKIVSSYIHKIISNSKHKGVLDLYNKIKEIMKNYEVGGISGENKKKYVMEVIKTFIEHNGKNGGEWELYVSNLIDLIITDSKILGTSKK